MAVVNELASAVQQLELSTRAQKQDTAQLKQRRNPNKTLEPFVTTKGGW